MRSNAILAGLFVAGLVIGGFVVFAVMRPAEQASPGIGRSLVGSDPGVAMTFRGDWTEAAYNAGDVVSLKGLAYVATSETPLAQAPRRS